MTYNQVRVDTTYYYVSGSSTIASTSATTTYATFDLLYLIFKFLICAVVIFYVIRRYAIKKPS